MNVCLLCLYVVLSCASRGLCNGLPCASNCMCVIQPVARHCTN
jgi:hypothetical protein